MMKEFKGTPGQWFYAGEHPDANVRYVCTSPTYNGCNDIATLFLGNANEQEANANLIATAPELLEALISAIEWIDAVPSETKLPTMPGIDRDWLDNVINKALGITE